MSAIRVVKFDAEQGPREIKVSREVGSTASKIDRTSVFQSGSREGALDVNALDQIKQLSLAAKIAQFGSRPPIITMLTDIKDSVARKLYKDANGKASPKGLLPSDPTFYTSDVHRHIESIWLLQAYKGMTIPEESKIGSIECFILTYQLYLQKFPAQSISFDRFFLLIRLSLYGKHIELQKCGQCDGPYLALVNKAYSQYCMCPVCEHSKQAKIK